MREPSPSSPAPRDSMRTRSGRTAAVSRSPTDAPSGVGTTIRWEVGDNPDGDGVRVLMTHDGWDPDNPAIGRVNVGWGQILGKLKGYVETGEPDPFFVN